MPFDREEREMHTTTCGDCGNECQVPFKPKEDRPVYCRECFQNHKPEPRQGGDRFGGRSGGGRSSGFGEIEVLDLVIETTDHEKCMTQNVGIVELIVKYHSNQEKTDLFIAENASKATKIRNSVLSKFQNSFIL